jgi:hypothetical protein
MMTEVAVSSETSVDLFISVSSKNRLPIPVAALSKAWVCGRSLAGIAGSNPAGGGGLNVRLLRVNTILQRRRRETWTGYLCPIAH